MPDRPAILLDLDGTLTDSVYQHALAWTKALELGGIKLSVWRIHRRIGMSGGLLAESLAREVGRELSDKEAAQVKAAHAKAFRAQLRDIRLLPGAKELLRHLTKLHVPWAIATSGALKSAAPLLKLVDPPAGVPIITRDDVAHAKPNPDLWLAAAARLSVPIESAIAVGDSVWDLLAARRARALGVGLLSGGYGAEELQRAGAYQVYEDPADLLGHIDELGIRAE
ncbi:MAG TPA: HAD family hydrolase [Gemmatimonadales bacterium]|nr:HAD family hydrolase [Gemmatimonadales bacterium]